MIRHPNTPVTRLLSKLILCRPERHPWSLRRHLARGGALTAILLSINTKPASAANDFYSGASNNTWSTSANNWSTTSGGPYTSAFASSSTAVFEGTATTVTASGSLSVGGITFTTDGYTINGGTLALTKATITTGAGTDTIGSVIGGSAGLTKAGNGTLILTGNNTFTGNVAVNAGTLSVTAGGISANGVLNIDTGGTFNQSGGTNVLTNLNIGTSNGSIGSYVQSGGVTTLSLAQNTLIGDVAGGQGSMEVSGGTFTAYTTSAAAIFDVGFLGSGTLTVDGGLVTVGRLLVASGAGSSGLVTVSSGTLNINDAASTSSSPMAIGTSGNGVFNQTGGVVNVASGGFLDLGFNSGTNGQLNISGGTFNVGINTRLRLGNDGTGVMTVTGGTVNLGNTFIDGLSSIGSLTISGGSVIAPNTAAFTVGFNSGSSGTVTVGTGTTTGLLATPQVTFGSSSGAHGTFNLDANGLLQTQLIQNGASGAVSTFNFNGGTLQATASTTTLMQGLTTANVQAGGAIIDTGTFTDTIGQALVHDTTSGAPPLDGGLTKLSSGTLVLSGANTYTGTTTITAGVIQLSGSGTLGSTSAALNDNATLDLNGTSQSVGTLFGSGTILNSAAGTRTLSVGNDGGTGTFTGVIEDNGGTGGKIALTKAGAGTEVLTGSNSYSGGTSVNGGTLQLSNSSGSATGSGTLSVGAGATLAGTGSSSGSSFSITGSSSTRATVLVGHNNASDLNTTSGMGLSGTGTSTIASANLVFNLNAGVAGQSNQLNVGATNIAFGTVGLQNTTLTLNLEGSSVIAGTDYVLIAGTTAGGGSGQLGSQFTGLDLGTSISLGSGITETQILDSNFGGNGSLNLSFGSGNPDFGTNSTLILYQNTNTHQDFIEVEVIPEPGTWAMIVGGLAMLVLWQRRNNKRP